MKISEQVIVSENFLGLSYSTLTQQDKDFAVNWLNSRMEQLKKDLSQDKTPPAGICGYIRNDINFAEVEFRRRTLTVALLWYSFTELGLNQSHPFNSRNDWDMSYALEFREGILWDNPFRREFVMNWTPLELIP